MNESINQSMSQSALFRYGSFDKLKTSLHESRIQIHPVQCKGLLKVTNKVQKLYLQILTIQVKILRIRIKRGNNREI